MGYPLMKTESSYTFIHFDTVTIPATDRPTDRQTDGQTELL